MLYHQEANYKERAPLVPALFNTRNLKEFTKTQSHFHSWGEATAS